MTAETCPVVRVAFENERHPTGGAGIGGCVDVVHQGQYLYVLQQRNLVILDLSATATPRPVGTLPDLGNLRQIAVPGTTAFITAREDGLFVVDVSDQSQPKLITRYDTVEFATGIDLCDGFAFVACRWFGVEIIDVSDVEAPRHVSIMRVGEAQSCEVSNGILYAGAWEERRVAICDVRNPAAPKQLSTVALGGRGDGVTVQDGILYAATGHHQRGAALTLNDPRYGSGNGMDIVDVSDPANPKHLSRLQFDWRFYYGWPDTWRVMLSFPYAYLCHTYHGVFVLDVSDPQAPKVLEQIRIPLFPGEQGYRKLSMDSKSGTRPPILPFDPAEKLYSPVCGLAVTDDHMYISGLFSDLHVFEDRDLVRAPAPKTAATAGIPVPLSASGDFHAVDLPAFTKTLAPVATGVTHYRPAGQVYAAVEDNGVVYAACGSAGIHVLDRELRLQAAYATAGFAMDVQLAGSTLYSAESSGGLVCYQVHGTELTRMHAYACGKPVKQVRITADGRFAVIHAGGASYEILTLSDDAPPELVEPVRGWGGLVYYRQLCNGFIEGRYTCGTWCAGRTFMLDLGGDEPVWLPDVPSILPDMEAGGYCPCGPYALLTRGGGYSFYPPGYDGDYDALPVHKPADGTTFYGKPTCSDDILIACNRVNGQVTLLDVSQLDTPSLLCQFSLNGSPDCAFIANESILIPAGNQGLLRAARRKH